MTASSSNVYYVAVNGSNDSDGLDPQRPWRTIGHAAAEMTAGDRCIVRGGTYRETVVPAASGREDAPIRYEAQPGERVVISGCDPVVGWTARQEDTTANAGVYEAAMDWSLQGDSGNIVFIDGELSHEAMWPRITDRLDRTQYAVVDSCTNEVPTYTIYDEDLLAFADGHWTGAVVACVNGAGYFISTAAVTDFREGTLYFDGWMSSAAHYRTTPGDIYFLTRSPRTLAVSEGWYIDPVKGRLTVRLPDGGDPTDREVEAKRREYAFDLRGCSYVQIKGFEIRAASITTENASYCSIDNVRIHAIDRCFSSRQSIYGRTKGIELGGCDNIISGSDIGYFEGIGINLSGQRNRVVNCHIHDGNLEASYASLIWAAGSQHLISHCTVTRSARTCISGVFSRSVIEYCDISHANCLTKDSGIIYLFNHDFDNTDIHHNWLHDNKSPHLSFGFYMDAWTSGVNLYRNVVWNIPHHGLHLNRPLQRTLIYNNTFLRSGDADSAVFLLDDMYGTQMINNIFSDGKLVKWGEDCLVSHNLLGVDGGFEDADHGDFRLRADSPALSAGMRIAGVSSPGGKEPDIGAYESSEPYWTAGHDFDRVIEAELVYSELNSKSAIGNGGFESGAWEPWEAAAGTPKIVYECAWDFSRDGYPSIVRSNKYGAMLGPGDRIEQRITGVASGAAYELWAGIKIDGEYRSAEQFDDIHKNGALDTTPDGGYAVYRDLRYIGQLTEGDWLKYAAVDFGSPGKYDHIALGMTKIFDSVTVEVYLDSLEGERIAAISQEMDYDDVWRYFSTPIPIRAGIHDVYFKIKGPGRLLLSGFKLGHNNFFGNGATMAVQGSQSPIIERGVFRLNWEAKMVKLPFTTKPDETEVVVSFENKSRYFVYLDDIGMWRPDPEES
ncbi:right-handed parallel beta-helix repeat-containing protein [Paenibacillus sepulcri]